MLLKMQSVNQTKKPADHTPQLDEQLCFSLYAASLAMNKVYRKRLRPLGITYSQYLVLMVLWQQDALTVTGIGERLFLDSATLTPLLKRMETQQLISRTRAVNDERQVIIALLPAGSVLRKQAAALNAAVSCATDCSPTEADRLNQQLIKLRGALLHNS